MGLGAQPETKPESLESVVLNKSFHESVGLAHNGLLPVMGAQLETKPESHESAVPSRNFHGSVDLDHNGVLLVTR